MDTIDYYSDKYGNYNPEIIARNFNNRARAFLDALEKGRCACCNPELKNFLNEIKTYKLTFPFSIFETRESFCHGTPSFRLSEDKFSEFCREFEEGLNNDALSLFTFLINVLYSYAVNEGIILITSNIAKVLMLFSEDFKDRLLSELESDICGISEEGRNVANELRRIFHKK